MTLLQLSYFVEICHTGSFTRAAEAMHVTQPTITSAVKNLEIEFNIMLIEHNNKELSLTLAGKDFLEMSIQLLNYADHMRMIMQDKVEEVNRVFLGIPYMTNAACFPELFGVLHKRYPDIEIQSTHDVTANLLPLLDTGRLNMLLVPYKPTDGKYCCLIWKKTRFLFCVSENHPLAGRKLLSVREVCREPVISYFGDAYLRNFNLAERYRENGHEMEVICRCSQINIMQDLIRENEGCGFLIEDSFSEDSGIVGIPMEEGLPVTVYLVWTKESARLSSVQKTLKCIRAYLGGKVQD